MMSDVLLHVGDENELLATREAIVPSQPSACSHAHRLRRSGVASMDTASIEARRRARDLVADGSRRSPIALAADAAG